MASSEDYAKYFCAMGSRSVRRVAAKVYTASELDAQVRTAILRELTEALKWQRIAAFQMRRLDDRLTEDEDGDECAFEIDFAVYSDGRPVFTVVDWMDGYAAIVHHPDGLQPESDTGELAEEMCPCCGGMPETASGRDDAGERDERDSAT